MNTPFLRDGNFGNLILLYWVIVILTFCCCVYVFVPHCFALHCFVSESTWLWIASKDLSMVGLCYSFFLLLCSQSAWAAVYLFTHYYYGPSFSDEVCCLYVQILVTFKILIAKNSKALVLFLFDVFFFVFETTIHRYIYFCFSIPLMHKYIISTTI